MDDLTLDCETRSTVDLRKSGAAVYAESPETHVWCVAYAFGDGPISVWKEGEPCPPAIAKHVRAGGIVRAFHAHFEINIWLHILGPRHGWPVPDLSQWRCTMVAGMAMSLPGSLKAVGAALGLNTGKIEEEHRQMLQLAKPRRARKGEDPTKVYWFDDQERLERLYRICANDVRSERDVAMNILPLRPSEQKLWELDQRINLRGLYVDRQLCHQALRIVETVAQWLNDEIRDLTDGAVTHTTKVADIQRWLASRDVVVEKLDKEELARLLGGELAPDVRRVVEIRKEAAKAAVKKISALLAGTSVDDRARGLLQFAAASTGRWGGRRYQPQNLVRPRNKKIVDALIEAIATGSAEFVDMVHGEPLAAVSDCLRGMVGAAPGNVLYAADYSSIESRLIAWLAGEEWKLQAIRDYDAGIGPDTYKLAYAKAFGIAPEDVDDMMRQIGKVMELALGYQGGVGAFQKMAVGYGVIVEDARADELKVAWREAHPNVVQWWYDLEQAAKDAIANPGTTFYAGRIAFRKAGTFLYMRLPGGRAICYPYPCMKRKLMPWTTDGALLRVDVDPETGEETRVYEQLPVWKDSICYKGVDQFTRQWSDQFAHGGLLANNAVQGTARDVEAEAIVRVEAAGYPVVLSVHDEVVSETPEDFGSLDEFKQLMATLPEWAEGLPLAVSGFKARRYQK